MNNKLSLKDTLTGTFQTVEDRVEKVLYEKWHIRLHRHAKHHIHKMRKRPDHHKDIISFSIAFIVTMIVFAGWYFISFPKIIESYQVIKKENSALNTKNPLEGIRDSLTPEETIDENNIQVE